VCVFVCVFFLFVCDCTVCGNGVCETGEACLGTRCDSTSPYLCPGDCPGSTVSCPVSSGLVSKGLARA
jgi:hypothetical protein